MYFPYRHYILLAVLLQFRSVFSEIPSCTAGITQVDTEYGEITVSAISPATAMKCVYYLLEWGGVAVSPSIWRISSDCGAVAFLDKDVGKVFSYDTNYQFKYAEFTLNTNIESGTASCETTGSSVTLAAPSCLTTNIVAVRSDNAHVSASLVVARSYMLCQMTEATNGNVRTGPCTDRFDFPASDSDNLSLSVQIWSSSSPTADCSGSGKAVAVSPYTCSALQSTLLSGGVYSFRIASPAPVTGTCELVSVNNPGSKIEFPCSSSISFTITELAATFPSDGIVPNASLDLKWTFTNGVFTCDSATLSVSNIQAPVVFSAASTDGANVRVTLDANPVALLAAVTNLACKAKVVGCDQLGSPVVSSVFTSCAITQYVDFVLTNYSTCIFAIEFYSTDAPATIITTSDTVSASVAIVPGASTPTVVPYGEDCLLVSWAVPAALGGAQITCYQVDRKNGASELYFKVADICDGSREYIACDFLINVAYSFRITAFNREGSSLSSGEVTGIYMEHLWAAPASIYVVSGALDLTAGASATFDIQLRNPDGDAVNDTAPNDRIFVSRLVNRGKLDTAKSALIPLESGDTGYTTSALPLAANTAPLFTVASSPSGSGVYAINGGAVTLAGFYSVASYSLEAGGLWGQYWSNPFLVGTPDLERKDLALDFTWNNNEEYYALPLGNYVREVVSIRWSGFLKVASSIDYTFYLTTSPDPVRLYINEVLVIGQWKEGCVVECNSGLVALAGTPQYNHIRLEYKSTRRLDGNVRAASVKLEWAAVGFPRQVVSQGEAFKGLAIANGGALKLVNVIASTFAVAQTVVTLPTAPYVAGSAFVVLVQAKDLYDNNLLGDVGRTFTATYTGAHTGSLVGVSSGDGLYTISFVPTVSGTFDISVNDSIDGLVLAVTPVTIVALGPANDVSTITVTDNVAVDTDLLITFRVIDSVSNVMLTTLPSIVLTATWTGDTVGNGIIGQDETALRSNRFGSSWHSTTAPFTSYSLVWNSGTSLFEIRIRLPHAGTYTMTLGIVGGAAATSIASGTATLASGQSFVTLLPSTTYSAVTLLVISGSGFPTAEANLGTAIAATSGTAVTATVQLRDAFLNCVTSPPSPPTVTISINTEQANCTHSGAGQYSCSITPVLAGTGKYVSVTVGGKQASLLYLTTVGSVPKESLGPWLIAVSHGSAAYANTIITGLRSKYIAGESMNALVKLYDAANNALQADPSPPPTIVVSINAVQLAEQAVLNGDGTITITITAGAYGTGLSFVITVGGSQIVNTTVDVLRGVVSAAGTTCATWTANTVADVDATSLTIGYQPLVCSPKDVAGNVVDPRDNLSADAYCKVDTSEYPYAGVFVTPNYSYTTSAFVEDGAFSCYALLGQPGGLIGQYMENANVVDTSGGYSPLSDTRFTGAPLTYTRIDPYLSFAWANEYVFGGTALTTVLWTGVIVFPLADTYDFNVVATGGAVVDIGGTNYFSDIAATSVNAFFSIGPVSQFDEQTVSITFAFTAANPAFALKWKYSGDAITGDTYWLVPPSVFQAPLEVSNVQGTMYYTNPSIVELDPGVVSPPVSLLLLEAGATYEFIVTLKTAVGTPYFRSTCVTGTVFPGCLFSFTIPEAGAIGTVVTSRGDGVYDADLTMNSSYEGAGLLHGNLLLSGGFSPAMNAGVPLSVRMRLISVKTTWTLACDTNGDLTAGGTVASSESCTLTFTGKTSAPADRSVAESNCPGTGDPISFPSSCLFDVAYDGGTLVSVSDTSDSGAGVYTKTFNFPVGPISSSNLNVYLYPTAEVLAGSPISIIVSAP